MRCSSLSLDTTNAHSLKLPLCISLVRCDCAMTSSKLQLKPRPTWLDVVPTMMLAMRKMITPAGHGHLSVWCASAQAQRRGAEWRGAAAWYLRRSYAEWVGRVGASAWMAVTEHLKPRKGVLTRTGSGD